MVSAALAALLIPAAPAGAADARAGTRPCPAGYSGRIVWYYDLDNQYHEVARFCIPTGP